MSIDIEKIHSRFKIGEVAKLSGIGVEAVRFYEKCGLIEHPARTVSGYRVFGPAVLERIAFIKKAQVLGFTLDEIRQLIEHKRAGESPCAEVRILVSTRLTELEQKIEEMLQYRDDLKKMLKSWSKGGEAEGHVCGLIEGIDFGKSFKRSKK
jgi:DNA-binding transcriptional MerR regulator